MSPRNVSSPKLPNPLFHPGGANSTAKITGLLTAKPGVNPGPGHPHPDWRARYDRRRGIYPAYYSPYYQALPEPAAGAEGIIPLQDCLNRVLGLQLPLSGVIAAPDRSAIRSFQTRQGLPVNGVLDVATQQSLLGACNPAPAAPPPANAITPPGELEFSWLDYPSQNIALSRSAAVYPADYPYWSEDEEQFLGAAFNSIGNFVSHAAKDIGKVAGDALHTVADAASSVGDVLQKIPVIGAPLHLAFGVIDKTLSIADDLAHGKGLDKAVFNKFNSLVKDIKDTVQLAQTVVSFVPGIGQGIGGALGAGLALAEGKPIDQVMLDAVKGAVPGGPIAQAAFAMGSAAIQGKPVEEVVLSGLPIPADAKRVIGTGIHAAERLAKGERIDNVLLSEARQYLPKEAQSALDAATKLGDGKKVVDLLISHGAKDLQKDAQKALKIGVGMGYAKTLQQAKQRMVTQPSALKKLREIGAALARGNPSFSQAIKQLKGKGENGFLIAAAMLRQAVSVVEINAVRNRLNQDDRKGFDLAQRLLSQKAIKFNPVAKPKMR